MTSHLYHASPVQGLKQLEPRPSTHQWAWVYAVRDEAMAAPFLARGCGGDFACGIGRDVETGLPYLCERFAGAFDRVFAGKAGSVYTLEREGFVYGQTSWDEEWVAEQAVTPSSEQRITDAWVYLKTSPDSTGSLSRAILRKLPGFRRTTRISFKRPPTG